MSKKITGLIMLAIFALSFSLIGCSTSQPSKSPENAQKAPQAQNAKKVLKMGAETTFPPFEFQDEKSKDYIGFDVDLMKAVAKQMNCDVEVVSMGFDALIPALESGQLDVIVSGMTITEERSKKVNFSDSYYKSGISILVKNDNNTVKNVKDLEGKTIAVQIGTTGAEEARKIKNTTVKEFNSPSEAFMELKAGGADAVLNDLPVNEYYLNTGGAKDVKQVGEVISSENFGIAAAKKNTQLISDINKALNEIKKNGEYEAIYLKWFGTKPK